MVPRGEANVLDNVLDKEVSGGWIQVVAAQK
jgi:hypothetical protein